MCPTRRNGAAPSLGSAYQIGRAGVSGKIALYVRSPALLVMFSSDNLQDGGDSSATGQGLSCLREERRRDADNSWNDYMTSMLLIPTSLHETFCWIGRRDTTSLDRMVHSFEKIWSA